MFDQKSNETLVRAERCAMNADRDLVDVVAVLKAKIKIARLREIDLVGRDGKLASDYAPRLHVNLRSVKGRFVRNFDIVDPGVLRTLRVISSVFFQSSGSSTNFWPSFAGSCV